MLHERGHSVTVVCGRRARPSFVNKFKATLRGRKLPDASEGASHLDGMPYAVVRLDRARPIVESDLPDADLVLSSWWETTEWMWELPESKGVKVNFLQHHEIHPWLPADRVRAVWRLPIPKIVVSEWLQQIAKDVYGDGGAILVPNGLDTEQFGYVKRGPSGQMIIGAMASGMDQSSFKRFWLAVEAVKVMQSRGVGCKFVGFGSETDPAQLPADSLFEVHPSQDRIAEIYASCDCWLFTSDKEGYGLPLLEAMSCGTPVVATPAGAAPELLASGGGKLVRSDEPDDLADAVSEVLHLNDQDWRLMSELARAEAEKHSWGLIGDQMEGALELILAKARQ